MNVVSLIKSFVIWVLDKSDIYMIYSLRHNGPLFEDGWFRSNREKSSVDANGEPIPWITYPALDFIRKRITPNLTVFEYGSGGSTIWWANRVKNVVSVEHDREWYEKIKSIHNNNVNLRHINLIYGGEYSKSVRECGVHFDIIVVDGRDRVSCIKQSVDFLKPNGIIILDNSDRVEYIDAINFLQNKGFRSIEFVGFCPIVNLKSETSIFYRSENLFGI